MNLRGWSELSDTNTVSVYTEVVPLVVQQPMNGVLTTETEIDVYWPVLATQAEVGGSTCTILSYNV
jgi:hypothetical protein